MKKASGGDGIPVELFQILKDDSLKVLQSICQQIWKIQQWPQDWKRSVFIPIPKKGNAKECSNYHTIDISPCNLDSSLCSSSPAFLMMYSAYKLNKNGGNLQPWPTPFPIRNQSVVLTVASWPAYRFIKRQVRWSGISYSFKIFRSLLWSTQSKSLA